MSHARPRLSMLAAMVGALAASASASRGHASAASQPPFGAADVAIPAPVFEEPRPASSNQRKRRKRAKHALSHRLGRKARVR